MKKHLLLLLLFVVGMVNINTAQTHNHNHDQKQNNANWCGSSLQDNIKIRDRMVKNRIEMADWVDTRNAVTWVPVKFHIVGNDTGGDHAREVAVFDMLCEVNKDYLDQDIQFFLKDGSFNYIKSTSANINPRSFAGDFQLSANKVNTALNIFVVKTIQSFGGGGNILGYYDPGSDWIVLQRDQVNAANAETATHEFGHFFSLPHPFLGWDGDYWDENTHGIPVGPLSPGGIPNEYVNGSNCATAGDMICDTKANYGFGFGWNNCNYTGPSQDPNGDLLNTVVQEENFMAYFLGCASEFTPDQKALINLDLNSSQRAYLGAGNVTPPTDDITIPPTMSYPIGGEITPFFNVVEFYWDPVPGATHYLIEIDKTNTFSFNPASKIVTGTYAFMENTVNETVFESNKKYYWRVKPFNLGNSCGPVTNVVEFRTGTESGTIAVNEIATVKEWKVSPNPIHENSNLNIKIVTDSSFDADVKIYNVSGQLIQTQAHNFAVGTSNLELNIESLSMGMYMLFIESEAGVLTEKIVVTR